MYWRRPEQPKVTVHASPVNRAFVVLVYLVDDGTELFRSAPVLETLATQSPNRVLPPVSEPEMMNLDHPPPVQAGQPFASPLSGGHHA